MDISDDALEDYLDNVLDEFETPKVLLTKDPEPADSADSRDQEMEQEFMKLLSENMGRLLNDIKDEPAKVELQEQLLQGVTKPEAGFQDQISQTMNKLKQSAEKQQVVDLI